MNGKQFGVVVLGVVIVLATLGAASMVASPVDDSLKLKVVTSFYPLAYLAKSIGGENVTVSTLISNNMEVHSWQPSASDILQADMADVFIYNGAGLEPWIENEILPIIDSHPKIILDSTAEIHLEEDHETDGYDHDGLDPHTWISPFLARKQAEAIYLAFVAADGANASYYGQRWTDLDSLLQELDKQYLDKLGSTQFNTIFVTHTAYTYLAERYGFEQEGVLGISANEQPSPGTIADLVDRMVDEGINTLFLDPVFTDEYIQTLKSEVEDRTAAPVDILKLYLMTGPAGDMDYIEQMEANLENLLQGLGG
ncbi:MAG TPA: metal ABC transporter substrate-binding protein [Methanomassiliicoccales archaeon]|nr:metal ABC transporter substrate-binding protein [Methanomassiliicoccales archaeon]